MTLMPFMLRCQGVKTVVFGPDPDLAASNAKFFDQDLAYPIQLRPLPKADLGAYGSSCSGNALLYARSDDPEHPALACYVRVAPHLRRNTRSSVMAANARIERFARNSAARLRRIAARACWSRPDP